jgi:chorismate mutase/prephenate dehydrogenase
LGEPNDADDLQRLRDALTSVDTELLSLVAQRQALSLSIGRAKRTLGMGTRDFAREKLVLDRAHALGEAHGLPDGLAERLLLLLIEASLSAQEQDRVGHAGAGVGRNALVIGGAGKMGRWFSTFLANQGWDVEVADPRAGAEGLAHRPEWRDGPLDHDLIVVATPLSTTDAVLCALAQRRPPGVVLDVASLKAPLRAGLTALRDAGVAVTSIHPMFGPDVNLLSGRHVLIVDLGVPRANALAARLFEATMAELTTVDLDAHDQLMAWILGLSHALNLAFVGALARSGAEVPKLNRISSSTFAAQLGVATRVSHENPALYYEIQALNDHGHASLNALVDAVTRLRDHVASHDREAFIAAMIEGRHYLASRQA